jgi:hypothetical protein
MFNYFFRKSKSSEDIKKVANEISSKMKEVKEVKEVKEANLEKTYDINKLRIKIPK